ncbi:oligosaccharide flippase family protein [bacterium]|jgi:O-antigen/teichoic acid export membrane protein|nr:oligosaccharide flippase family protein [bacterium]
MVKSLVKKSSVYLFAKVIAAAFSFFTLPILVRLLSQEDIGLIVYFNAIVPMAIAIVFLGTEGAMVRLYFEYKNKDILFSNIFILIIMILLISSIALIIQSNYFVLDDQIFVYILFAYVIFSGIKNYLLSYFRIQEKAKTFFSIFVILTILGFVFQVVAGLEFKDPYYVLIAKTMIEILAIAFVIYYFYNHINLKLVSTEVLKNILKYALPILPYSLALYAINTTDKIFVKYYLGLEETAIYGIAFTFVATISIFSSSIDMAWGPYFYKNIEHKKKEHFSRLTTLSYGLLSILVVIIIIFSKDIVLLVYGQEYLQSSYILSILMFGTFIYAFYLFPVKSINYKKKNSYTAILAVIIMIINIVLNYIFIIALGSIGCAIATTLSNVLFVLALLYIAEKTFPITYEYLPLISFVLIVFVNLIISYFFDFSLAYKLFILFISIAIILSLLFYKYKEFKIYEEQS